MRLTRGLMQGLTAVRAEVVEPGSSSTHYSTFYNGGYPADYFAKFYRDNVSRSFLGGSGYLKYQ